jgi:thiol-disulfide isomerase/thioredoxin
VSLATLTVSCGGAPERATVGNRAPHFSLTSLDGAAFDSASLEGRIVVLNFWATWCAPCRKEIPELIELSHAGEASVVGIALDEEGESKVRPFAESFGIDYPILLGNQETFLLFDGFVVPHTVVLDPALNVYKMYRGPVERESLDADIRAIAAGS